MRIHPHTPKNKAHVVLHEVVRITWKPAWVPLRLVDYRTFAEAEETLQKAQDAWSAKGPKDQKNLASHPQRRSHDLT